MKLRKVLLLNLILFFIPFLAVNAEIESSVNDEDQSAVVEEQSTENDGHQEGINLSEDDTTVSNSQLSNDKSDQSNTQTHNVIAYNDEASDEDDNGDDGNTYFDERYQKYAYNTPEYKETHGRSLFIFDPNIHRWMAYNSSGELVGSGKASGGRGFCPDIHRRCKTPIGTFRVYSMGGPGCVSTKFPVGRGGAPMPYCMFFHGGFAIHGSYELPNYNASHGCIRVEPSAARWLQENVIGIGTTVVVKPY